MTKLGERSTGDGGELLKMVEKRRSDG